MSAKIMGAIWDLALPAPQRAVLLAMADHADHDGNNVFPSVGLIAWKTDYSPRQVQRIIRELVKAGLLITVYAKVGRVTKYRIDLSKGKCKSPFKDKVDGQDVTPDKMSPLTQLCHTTPDTAMSYKPSIEPSIKTDPGVPPDALKKKDEEIASLRAQIDDLTAKVAMLMQSNAAAMTPSKTELSLVKANPPAPRPTRPVDPLIDAIAYGSFGLTGKLNGQVTRITGIVYGCKTAPVGLLQMAFQTKDMSTISQDRLNELIGNVKAAYSWHSKKLKDGKPLSPPNTALTIWSTIQNYLKEEEAAAPSSNIDERGMDLDYWEYNPETKLYQRRG